MGGEGGRNGGRKGGGESAAIRSRIRWCSTRWRLGVYHGARRGEVAGAVHIDSRDEGRVEDRNDFGVISSTAEPVFEACLCWELKACERKRGRGAKKAVL